MKSRKPILVLLGAGVALVSQTGCLAQLDVQRIAEGQFISFVNALINTVSSDAIRGALGG